MQKSQGKTEGDATVNPTEALQGRRVARAADRIVTKEPSH